MQRVLFVQLLEAQRFHSQSLFLALNRVLLVRADPERAFYGPSFLQHFLLLLFDTNISMVHWFSLTLIWESLKYSYRSYISTRFYELNKTLFSIEK